jgi:hypothetical protein
MKLGDLLILRQRLAACGLMAALVLTLCLASCRFVCWSCDDSDCEPETYRIQIDSLAFRPAQPAAGDTVYVLFWGLVGTSTCYSFTHFAATRDSFQLDVTAWGEHSCDSPCGFTMIYLEAEELSVFPVFAGDLRVVVHQPDGGVLVDTVTVHSERSGRET